MADTKRQLGWFVDNIFTEGIEKDQQFQEISP